MLGQKINDPSPPGPASVLLREDHLVLLMVDGILAVYWAAQDWLQCRRTRRVLAHLDDRQLRDIGVSRADALRESRRWWGGWNKNLQALAELDDRELKSLSEAGRQMRRQARHGCKAA